MKNPITNKKGVALILVLLMVSVIVVLTLQLNVSSRSQVHEAANLGDGIRVLYIAKSGLFAGMGLLSEDRGDADTLNEAWARTEALSEQSKSYFDGGYLELVIEDETGKININKLVAGNGFNGAVKGLLTRLLTQPQFQIQEREVEDLLNAIKDWIDADSEVTATGAENAYYQGLGKSYTVRNGPMESIDELLMVRGVTRELFYGTAERPGLARLLKSGFPVPAGFVITTAAFREPLALATEIDRVHAGVPLAQRLQAATRSLASVPGRLPSALAEAQQLYAASPTAESSPPPRANLEELARLVGGSPDELAGLGCGRDDG